VQTKTGPPGPVQISQQSAGRLLDLGFFEFDVLARDRIVFLLDQLVGHGARILLGDIIEAGIRRGNELDLDGDRLGHGENLNVKKWAPANQRGAFAAQPSLDRPKVKVFAGEIAAEST
jgi:hypothetical protein